MSVLIQCDRYRKQVSEGQYQPLCDFLLEESERQSWIIADRLRGAAQIILSTPVESEKYESASRILDYVEGLVNRQQMVRRVVDYTQMALGKYYLDEPTEIKVCPKCNRHGVVCDGEPNTYHLTLHKMRIQGGMISEILDSCKLDSGLSWPKQDGFGRDYDDAGQHD
jgi:hypothetical protein